MKSIQSDKRELPGQWPGLLLAGLVLLLSGCALPEEFDPYSPTEPAVTLDFHTIVPDKAIEPAMLRPPSEPYRVGPGDVLDIEVAEAKGTRAETMVLPDGMLYYDVADGVQVAGKTLPQVSTLLADALREDYPYPIVSVNLSIPQSQRFWLLGQVKQPGAYPLASDTTLLEAISMGKGLYSGELEGQTQEIADLNRSMIVRNGEMLPVDFFSLVERGDMSQNVYVQPGDYIYMASAQDSAVYVLGAVKKPGPIYFLDEITAIRAFAQAGGPAEEAIVTKALVIRGSLSRPRVAVVNLYGIARGYNRDFELAPGDILWVPKSPWTTLNRYVNSILTTAAQSVAIAGGYSAIGLNPDGTSISISAGL